MKYVFSYRFYTSHLPYLWCKRIYTSCRTLCNLKNELYDIGTKNLYVQCFVTTGMFLFCKSIFFSGMCRIFRDLAFGSIKTRFKGFWDIFSKICVRPWIRRNRFYWTFAPGGRLSYEAYNVFTCLIYIYITFTFIFINLYLHLHYILNLHLHLHLYYFSCFFYKT